MRVDLTNQDLSKDVGKCFGSFGDAFAINAGMGSRLFNVWVIQAFDVLVGVDRRCWDQASTARKRPWEEDRGWYGICPIEDLAPCMLDDTLLGVFC